MGAERYHNGLFAQRAFILIYAAVECVGRWRIRGRKNSRTSAWPSGCANRRVRPGVELLRRSLSAGWAWGGRAAALRASLPIGAVSPRRRAVALSIFMLGLPIGIFWFTSKRDAGAYGWRKAFLFACVPGLILAVLALDWARIAARRGTLTAGRQRAGSPAGCRVEIVIRCRFGGPCWVVLGIPTICGLSFPARYNFNMCGQLVLPAFLMRSPHGAQRSEQRFFYCAWCGRGDWSAGRRLGRAVCAEAGGRAVVVVARSRCSWRCPCIYFALGNRRGAAVEFMLLMGLVRC